MSEPCKHIVPGYAADPKYDVFAVHCGVCGAEVRPGFPYMLLGIPYHHSERPTPWMGIERVEKKP